MTDQEKSASQKGRRIYEYRTKDGVTLWSFEKFPTVVKHNQSLTMVDRVGTHFDNHLSELRALRRLIQQGKDE